MARSADLDGHEVGASEEERAYRIWCLDNKLFLNPLNDLGAHRIAARDILHLPPFVAPIDEPPSLLGLFNQLKQEFVTARWLYYDGTRGKGVHFADRDVVLLNTLDYPTYSIAIEKVKAAYRLAYSLFDKIAFFLNAYLDLSWTKRGSISAESGTSTPIGGRAYAPSSIARRTGRCADFTGLRGTFSTRTSTKLLNPTRRLSMPSGINLSTNI